MHAFEIVASGKLVWSFQLNFFEKNLFVFSFVVVIFIK